MEIKLIKLIEDREIINIIILQITMSNQLFLDDVKFIAFIYKGKNMIFINIDLDLI